MVRGNRFGKYLRKLRTRRGVGLRKLAMAIGISPTYLSKVERGEMPPPSEQQVVALAKILGEDRDVFLAMAGRIASDLPAIIKKHPREYAALLRALRSVRRSDLHTLFDGLGVSPAGSFTIVEMKRPGIDPKEGDRQIAEYKEMLARIDNEPLIRSRETFEAKIGNRRIDLLVDGRVTRHVTGPVRYRKQRGQKV